MVSLFVLRGHSATSKPHVFFCRIQPASSRSLQYSKDASATPSDVGADIGSYFGRMHLC